VPAAEHYNSRKSVCIHGHSFTVGNCYVWVQPSTGRPHRKCRECNRLTVQRRRGIRGRGHLAASEGT
jgi:hypothetical protein